MTDFEEKVLNLLESIDKKLDKLLGSGTGTKEPVSQPVESSEPHMVKPSSIIEKQEAEERDAEKPAVEGRRVCPDCGGTAFNTQEDKNNILHSMGGMKIYAKKYICKNCGKEVQ